MKQSKNTQKNDLRLDRRGFLKSSSAIAGGAAALGSLSIERGAFAQADDTVKVALVGCGGRGSGAADQALGTSGDVKLVAMADAFRDRMDGSQKGLERKHGIKAQVKEENKFVGFDAYKNAIEMADVAILATPPGFRPIHFAFQYDSKWIPSINGSFAFIKQLPCPCSITRGFKFHPIIACKKT